MQRVFIRLVAFGAACWLCVYPLVLTLAGIVVLVGTGQGRELLEWTVHEAQRGSHRFFFHASVLAWSAATWYSALVLLERRFERPFGSASLESDEPFALWLRKWMPRILGIAMYPPLAAQFLASGQLRHGVALAAVGVLWWVFLLYRRSLLGLAGEPGAQRPKLGWKTAAALGLAIATLHALLVGFLFSEVALPRFIGAAPIALLAFAAWTLVGSIVFVLLPKSYRLPSLACAPLVLALAAAWVDNHELRRLPASGVMRAASIEESAYAWLASREALLRQAAPGRKSIPVYIAAAEGGGLRAAYWTGSVLGRLEDATGGRFSQHLFAVSGVSGGSLGAAAFVAEAAAPGCEGAAGGSVERCVQRFLAQDFLSPAVAYLLFPDALQRFVPWPVRRFDRSRALEAAWERSWSETHPGAPNAFAAPFEALGSSFGKTQAPRLFLNGTRVETGRRVLVSPAVAGNGEMPGVDDLLAVGGSRWSLPLSAAVHLSARFTYVSPAAKICREPVEACDNDAVWGRVVDGGYHENSGAQTAAGVLRAFRRAAWRFQRAHPELPRIEPYVILISNDPASGRLCEPAREPVLEHFAQELLAPLEAVLNTRVARGADARRALADAAAARAGDVDADCRADAMRQNTLEFSLADALSEKRVIALGWLLANGSTHEMQAALCAPRHAEGVRAVQAALGVEAADLCTGEAAGRDSGMRPVRR
jgi:hypothetical protein